MTDIRAEVRVTDRQEGGRLVDKPEQDSNVRQSRRKKIKQTD